MRKLKKKQKKCGNPHKSVFVVFAAGFGEATPYHTSVSPVFTQGSKVTRSVPGGGEREGRGGKRNREGQTEDHTEKREGVRHFCSGPLQKKCSPTRTKEDNNPLLYTSTLLCLKFSFWFRRSLLLHCCGRAFWDIDTIQGLSARTKALDTIAICWARSLW